MHYTVWCIAYSCNYPLQNDNMKLPNSAFPRGGGGGRGKLYIKFSPYALFGMYCCIVYIIFKLRIVLTRTTLKMSIMWFSSTVLVGILVFIAFLHGVATVVTQTPQHITIIHYVEFKILYTVALSFLNDVLQICIDLHVLTIILLSIHMFC